MPVASFSYTNPIHRNRTKISKIITFRVALKLQKMTVWHSFTALSHRISHQPITLGKNSLALHAHKTVSVTFIIPTFSLHKHQPLREQTLEYT